MKMNFEEFKKTIKEKIGEYLTEDYVDADMSLSEVKKSGGESYDALMIRKAGEERYSVIPALNLTEAYKKYQNGQSVEQICEDLADVRMNVPIPEGLEKDMFMNFDKVKGKIYPRLVNSETSKDYLITRPHTEVEDLSMVYAVRINENSTGFAEAVIDYDLAKMWGVDVEDLHEAAMSNMEAHEPVFVGLEQAMFGEFPGPDESTFDLDSISDDCPLPLYMLTNKQKTKGAVMALCAKFMDQITAKFGDVYVLPSSVDEVLIMPKSAVADHEMDLQDLARMVQQVNIEAVRPEDRLSDNVYEYDSQTQSLKLAVVAPEQGAGLEMEM